MTIEINKNCMFYCEVCLGNTYSMRHDILTWFRKQDLQRQKQDLQRQTGRSLCCRIIWNIGKFVDWVGATSKTEARK